MALKVGFCGCLTTFASWNTQMVVMLDGTDTVLGSQVVAALCGYLVGLSTSVAAFVFGRHVHHAWCRIHPSHVQVPQDSLDTAVVLAAPDDAIMEQGGDGLEGTEVDAVPVVSPEESPSLDASCGVDKKPQLVNLLPGSVVNLWNTLLGIRVLPFVLLTGITSGFVVGDVVYGSLFYRNMWMCVVLSPFGALLRWYLAHKYNEVSQEETPLRIKGYRLDWVPWGTVFANMFAVVISVVAQALQGHVGAPGSPEVAWSLPFLLAVESGFSGSLSTVSTFVHELVDLHETPTRMNLYGFGSLAAAMFLGLLVYSPLIRYL
jgi:fluoride ion exporter CrcB/FEX